MKTLIIPRGKGKTTELIKTSANTGFYIVCSGHDEAQRIQMEAHDMGLKIPLPITYHEFINRRYYERGIPGFLIDNADMMLQEMSTVAIHAITVSS